MNSADLFGDAIEGYSIDLDAMLIVSDQISSAGAELLHGSALFGREWWDVDQSKHCWMSGF